MSSRYSYFSWAMSSDRLRLLVHETFTQKERVELEKWFADQFQRMTALRQLLVVTVLTR